MKTIIMIAYLAQFCKGVAAVFVCNHGVSCNTDERKAKLTAEWALAMDKLSVTFTATHGGGYPPCLRDKTAEKRRTLLMELGFSAVRVGEREELEQLVDIGDSIWVNLLSGWVWDGVSM